MGQNPSGESFPTFPSGGYAHAFTYPVSFDIPTKYRSTPGGYAHGRLLPWLPNFLGYLFVMRIVN